MSAAELANVAKIIQDQARALLVNHEKLSELEATSHRTRIEMESGRGFDAVLDMIRSLEQVVSSALGPNQSRAFLERVNQQLSS
jgi:hypothetical protein